MSSKMIKDILEKVARSATGERKILKTYDIIKDVSDDSEDEEGVELELRKRSPMMDMHLGEEPDESCSSEFPPTYLVVRLNPTVKPEALAYLIRRITDPRQNGGAELLVRSEPHQGEPGEEVVLHISASKLKFLESAEYMDIKKVDSHGVLRDFSVEDLDNFLYDDVNLDNILTSAEKQAIIMNELQNIRANEDEHNILGYSKSQLFPGQSIFRVYYNEGIITNYYPLHDQEKLDELGSKWYWAFFQSQPFDEIRKYFGEGIALYFSFLGFYTVSLLGPAILGLIQLFLPESVSHHSLVFFCVFNVIWVTVFLELWKRKCAELAYVWGTLRMTKWEEPRASFWGEMEIDPVSGRYYPKYPWWKTSLKAYFVSLPIVLCCLLGAFWIMLYSFWAEEMLLEAKQKRGSQIATILVYFPSIIYAALVWLMNFWYQRLADVLTEWENHRTQSQFERHRVTKLILFEFVNNFMSLFYIAFYIQDLESLKYQVVVMLIIQQAINNLQEALIPFFMKDGLTKLISHVKMNLQSTNKSKFSGYQAQNMGIENDGETEELINGISCAKLGLKPLDPNDNRIRQSQNQGKMDSYTGTYDDYLELFIQFGYVFLFSSVYPVAAIWGILNNMLEIRGDAFKLCKVLQRPVARRVKDIGAWQMAFEVMGVMSVMTNCALLCLSPELREMAPNPSPAEWLLLFVIIEHVLIAAKLALKQLIPDVPYPIKIALARLEYSSRKALKKQQAMKSRRHLSRRFRSVHGKPKTNVSLMFDATRGTNPPHLSELTRRKI